MFLKIDLIRFEEADEFFRRPRPMSDGPNCHSVVKKISYEERQPGPSVSPVPVAIEKRSTLKGSDSLQDKPWPLFGEAFGFPGRTELVTPLQVPTVEALESTIFHISPAQVAFALCLRQDGICSPYTRSFLTMLPEMSVKRKSRPWNR